MLSDSFIHYLEVEKRYSSHTLIAYKDDLEQFFQFADIFKQIELKEVSHNLIRGWIVELIETKHSNRSVARKLSCLRSFFKWQMAERLVEANPMLKIRAPKVEKRLPNFVKESEIERANPEMLFSNDFDGVRDHLMVEVLYQTGIRRSELINLKEKDVQNGQIKVLGKRNKERIIPIGSDLVMLINDYRLIKPQENDAKEVLFVKMARNCTQSLFIGK